MELRFGRAVVGSDGAVLGSLDRLLVDPVSREVTHVVVRAESVSEEVLVPLNMVQGSVEERLLLHVGAGDLPHLPRYYEGRRSSPPRDRVDFAAAGEPPERDAAMRAAVAVPEAAVELGPETRVVAVDGEAGALVGLTADQYLNRISELHATGLVDGEGRVPADAIGELVPEGIRLSVDRAHVGRHVRSAPEP